ncbi:MAG: hypothetical protein ABFS09_10645 [Thermodesulfobacteriota bacterium]
MAMDFNCTEVTIPCECGQLEGRLLSKSDAQQGPGLIICPPHPLLAGTMDNNVVQAIAHAMVATMPVLLFNYRAVGKSSHPQPDLTLLEYWHGLDERKEYGAVIREVGQVMEWSLGYFADFHLLGYSFGSYIALQAMNSQALSYTAISPPLAEHDFSALENLKRPGYVILAEKDEFLEGAVQQVPENVHCLQILKGADHLFIKREGEVAARVADFLLNIEKRSL